MTGGYPGGQAEYVRVPFGEVNCLKIPQGVAGKSKSCDLFGLMFPADEQVLCKLKLRHPRACSDTFL
jgi:hypothetical protein